MAQVSFSGFAKMQMPDSERQRANFCDHLGYISLLFLLIFVSGSKANAQWLSGYEYRKPFVIDAAQIPGSTTLTNYPLLVSFTDLNLAHTGNGGYIENINGYDIGFTAADGTSALDFEIEHYNGITGELTAWVRIPSLSATANTLIYLYYGNSSIVANPSVATTWNADYIGVWHLNDNFDDATTNSNDGIPTGTSNTGGFIAGGKELDGSGDYIRTSCNDLISEDNFTLSAWFRTDVTGFGHHMIWQGLGTANGFGGGADLNEPEMHISIGNISGTGAEEDDVLAFYLGDTDSEYSSDILNIQTDFTNTAGWNHVAVTVSNMAATPVAQMYLNGIPAGSDEGTTLRTDRTGWDTDLRFGRPGAAERYFDGALDEIRITRSILPEEQIAAEFLNISDPSGFYSTNSAPTDISLSASAIDENSAVASVVGILSSADQDAGDTHAYILIAGTGDTDNESFLITDDELRTNADFDFETKSVFSIRVRTMDDGLDNLTREEVFTITVNDVNESPTDIALSATSIDENLPAGTLIGTLTTLDPDAGDVHTYALVSGEGSSGNDSFRIEDDELRSNTVFNYDLQNSYSIRIRTTDNGTGALSYEEVFTIAINDINSAPIDIALSGTTIGENEPEETAIGNLSATDPDAGDAHTYSLVSGEGSTGNGSFRIEGDQLVSNEVFNYESQNAYSVRIRTTDNGAGALSYEEVFTIAVSDLNEGPTDIVLNANTIGENQPEGTVIGTLTTLDPDAGDAHTYALVPGEGSTGNDNFLIINNELRSNVVFDYDLQSSFSIRIRTTDNGTGALSYEEVFTIAINDINSAPIDIALSETTIGENEPEGTAIGNLSATDPDAGDAHTYSLVSGEGSTGNGSFRIEGDQLVSNEVFNYESQNAYSVRIRTTDNGAGALSYEEVFTIAVSDLNEGPTDMILSANTIGENQPVETVIGTLTTLDPDAGDLHTYALVSGEGSAGNDSFRIEDDELRSNVVFNYDLQNTYSVRIRSSDNGTGSLNYEEVFIITVNDLNSPPTAITLSANSIAENQPLGTVIGILSATDPDAGDAHSFALVTGPGAADNAYFEIFGNELRSHTVLNYESQNTFSIRIRATDDGTGSLGHEEIFTVVCLNRNDPPTDISISATTIDESQPAGTAFGIFSTTDQDPGDEHAYSLVSGAGSADNNYFLIVGNSLHSNFVFDFEAKNTFSVRVRTTDNGSGNLSYEEVLNLTVVDINEVPADIELSGTDIAENQASGTLIGLLTTTDPDPGNSHSYSFVPGAGSADNERFAIVGSQLRSNAVFDFETQSAYTVRVRSTDNGTGNLSREEVFSIDIMNINEAPVDIDISNSIINENQSSSSLVGTLSSTDQDAGDVHTYTLISGSGSTDNGLFRIVGSELRSNTSFNYEEKHTLSVRIRSTDNGSGNLNYEKIFAITVKDINEAPANISLSTASLNENTASGTSIGFLTTTDPDQGNTHAYSLVPGVGASDNLRFAISGNQLRSNSTFDFEAQNSFSVRIRSTDNGAGELIFEKVFNITLNDLNEAPSDISLSGTVINEGLPAGTVVGTFMTADPDGPDQHSYSLVSGTGATDNGSFTISNDVLRSNAVFDHNVKDTYSIRIRTTDNGTGNLIFEKVFIIAVSEGNFAPTDISLSNNHIRENQPAGTLIGSFITSDPDPGDAHVYSLTPGAGSADNTNFRISGNELRSNIMLNYEARRSFVIRVRSTDNGNGALSYEKVFNIAVRDVNDPPVDISLSGNTISENLPAGTAIGSLSTTDEDVADLHTYTLVSGAGSTDNAGFLIVGTELRSNISFNYEVRNSFSVRIRTTETGTEAMSFEKVVSIFVNDVNEAPKNIILSGNTIGENRPIGTRIGLLTANDEDTQNSHSYNLVPGTGSADNALFQVVGNELRSAAIFNYNVQNTFSVRLRTTDNGIGSLYIEEVFTIRVSNTNIAPIDIALSSSLIAENLDPETTIGILTTLDPDPADQHIYSLADGAGSADNALFLIVGDELKSNATFDFETKNIFSVRIRTTDNGGGSLSYEEVFVISISDANDPPQFEGSAPASVVAGNTYTYSILATDQDAGDILQLTAPLLPAWLNFTDHGDGKALLSGIPGIGDIGNINVTITLTDGQAAIQQAFTVTVLPDYALPVVFNDNLLLQEDSQLAANVLTNDHTPGNESITVSGVGRFASHGSGSLSSTGDLIYFPDANYYGRDTIVYAVCIEGIPAACDTGIVSLVIEPVNDAPVAVDRTIVIGQTGTTEICFPVTDIEMDAVELAEIIEVAGPVANSIWNGTEICFGYEAAGNASNIEELQCIVCDQGSPPMCDTVILSLVYRLTDDIIATEGISPNGDNMNDTWAIQGIEKYPQNTVRVYNRWGSLIFETTNYDNEFNAWDGSVNRGINLGRKASYGTYFYIIEFGTKQVRTGYIVVN
jgi:gliding motility-associated-like protein